MQKLMQTALFVLTGLIATGVAQAIPPLPTPGQVPWLKASPVKAMPPWPVPPDNPNQGPWLVDGALHSNS
ncbi:MAG: hypothetical protein JO108_29325 [Acidobacteriaceae bacterium]|nr:hypothetical protein [Acidobacteriaceae bacterium]